MKEFSERTLQKLNQDGEYYVYGLIDPRNDRIFYIGKGTGNRVFQHVAESGKHPESEKKKLRIISELEQAGYQVNNLVVGCYRPEHWHRVCDVTADRLPLHARNRNLAGMENRIFFECSSADTKNEDAQCYLYKSIEQISYIQRSQNPITYIGF